MNRVIHFEIHAVDPERMAKFYQEVFGWEIKEWVFPTGVEIAPENRYWGVMTAPEDSKEPGINGGIIVRKGPAPKGGEPVSGFICTIGVSSIEECVKKVEKAGGKNIMPKMPIAGLAWLTYCTDIDGNIFGIYQDDKNAK
jgi:hypothetical protein